MKNQFAVFPGRKILVGCQIGVQKKYRLDSFKNDKSMKSGESGGKVVKMC